MLVNYGAQMNVIEVVIVVARRVEDTRDRQRHCAHYHQPQWAADWPSSFLGNWNARWWILVRDPSARKKNGVMRGRGTRQRALGSVAHFLNKMIYFLTMSGQIAAVSGGCRLKFALSPLLHPGERTRIGQALPLLTCVSSVTVLLDTDISYWTGNKWHFPRQLVNF